MLPGRLVEVSSATSLASRSLPKMLAVAWPKIVDWPVGITWSADVARAVVSLLSADETVFCVCPSSQCSSSPDVWFSPRNALSLLMFAREGSSSPSVGVPRLACVHAADSVASDGEGATDSPGNVLFVHALRSLLFDLERRPVLCAFIRSDMTS